MCQKRPTQEVLTRTLVVEFFYTFHYQTLTSIPSLSGIHSREHESVENGRERERERGSEDRFNYDVGVVSSTLLFTYSNSFWNIFASFAISLSIKCFQNPNSNCFWRHRIATPRAVCVCVLCCVSLYCIKTPFSLSLSLSLSPSLSIFFSLLFSCSLSLPPSHILAPEK